MMVFSLSVSGVRYQFIRALLQNACLYSNPIYLAYFIFFSPYLLRIVSFLSPLLSFSLVIFCIVTLEELPPFDESPVKSEDEDIEAPFSDFFEYLQNPDHQNQPPNSCEHLEEPASILSSWVLKEIDPASLENQNLSNSNACKEPAADHGGEEETDQETDKKTQISVAICNGDEEKCWSTRREKEWKRTLACKRYEERRSWEGGDGMDVLWEIHKADSAKASRNMVKNSKAKSENKTKSSSSKRFNLLARKPDKDEKREEKDDGEVEEEEEEEESMKGTVCCLASSEVVDWEDENGHSELQSEEAVQGVQGHAPPDERRERESCQLF